MPVARCVMPVPENFQTGKCPFARCPKKIKRANAHCPLPDYSCPLASLIEMVHEGKRRYKKFMKKRNHMPICSYACSVKGSLDKGMEETFLDIL